jgi:FkbH-like protein
LDAAPATLPAGAVQNERAASSSVAEDGPANPATHSGLLVADFTADELASLLRGSAQLPTTQMRVAPYDQVTQSLLGTPSEGPGDFLVVWTRPENTIKSFGRLVQGDSVPLDDVLRDVDAFCELLIGAAPRYRFVFVPTWTMPHWHRGLGVADAKQGTIRALTAMNLRLMDRLAEASSILVLNAERWIAAAGRPAYTAKPWYLGKLAFPAEVLREAASDIKAALAALTGLARKVVVVDLDDTMWGGTVGEQGWQNLRVGGHDPHGEGFVDFQHALKALRRRGVLLAIASKNEEAIALEAVDSHPEMVLRRGDFVAWRINWRDKAQNIAELAAELNLGLQSFVFIDNDPVERARVREALPDVLVPEWPSDPLDYRNAIHALRCFDTAALTDSDADRTQLYAEERERTDLKAQVGSLAEWLKGLEMRVRVERLSASNIQRVVQLFNKTNQMNLSTRRLSADELSTWSSAPGRMLWAFTVADRFGDAGLTGIVSLEAEHGHGRIVDYILSCRVMGRKVEDTMLHVAVTAARAQGLARVEAQYVKTAKNKPCLEFFERCGFSADDDCFVWDAAAPYPLPDEITLEHA